jgi:hypothetical protein
MPLDERRDLASSRAVPGRDASSAEPAVVVGAGDKVDRCEFSRCASHEGCGERLLDSIVAWHRGPSAGAEGGRAAAVLA